MSKSTYDRRFQCKDKKPFFRQQKSNIKKMKKLKKILRNTNYT